jgi:glycine betaine/proline transport system permease protein
MTLAVLISTLGGIIAGTLCAQHPVSTRIMLTVCDTFQTFPSFIYLIPAMMLFGVANDTSVLIAIIIYALVPATRYTIQGMLSVPPHLLEAGAMAGVNRMQRYLSIELPMAFPHIALGINQTVVFALSMVIIGALIGTDDLGHLILKSLSDKEGVGNGLVLGLCVAFIGLAIDQVLRTWANQRKAALGLA